MSRSIFFCRAFGAAATGAAAFRGAAASLGVACRLRATGVAAFNPPKTGSAGIRNDAIPD